MSTNRNFEEIMKELIREENELIMSEYEKSAIESSYIGQGKIDEKILKMAIEYDKKKKENKKKKIISVLSKVAVVMMICVVSAAFVFPESVEAFRVKIFDVFFNEDTGSASLKGENEVDYLGDWTEYYYPEYMPENYKMIGAERMGERSIMLFALENGEHPLKIESIPANSTVNVDTDSTSIEKIQIGYYEGMYAVDNEKENALITWVNENNILTVQGDISLDKTEYIKIAENLKYIEK